MKVDNSQMKVLAGRYLRRDENGNVIETPEEMCWRVARCVAAAEEKFGADCKEVAEWAERFFAVMDALEFLPNSPTLINCGPAGGQLAACFVLPLADSIEKIFSTLKYTAIIHKSGGGTGFDFSRLRPKNSPVRGTGGRASGPVSFMRVFNAATEEIKQGGVRRGANIGILRADHPDIMEFIACKADEGTFRNFNLSVAATGDFFTAVERGSRWPLSFNGKVYREAEAREIFYSIARHAHASGEPGMLFIDSINRANPTPSLGQISATNPCGEQPLLPYESCNLGSINLSRLTKGTGVDWERLGLLVQLAVRFLDDVIEVNRFPLPQIAKATLRTRKIGLGVMGWADMLFKLGIPYDSGAALALAEEVMSFILQKAREASAGLARQRGPFPSWRQSVYYPELPLRNATLTTIAPTGSISAIAGTSSGIEPVYALVYSRLVLDDEKILVINKPFLQYLETEIKPESGENILKKLETGVSLQSLPAIKPEARAVFKTALEIAPDWHLKMQAAFQKYTDNAVSKTINLPANATVDEIASIFRKAYQLGLKGVTVYRTGSRSGQPLVPPHGCSSCRPA
ncbi:Ribonucleotide reductase, alpha subunit [Pelotomaculum thermopropionicum SI]|uniref:Vitamin B12-dependent ribonucleotide reductase n=1 Tax=Pelotomaculum thermopropionicum (strain DSM 13744 / JCM 10971 / SI) TaxID=370438 RepID=A5D1W7_PELTS|nr:Ribonucleotide reductase, alpha subunit [Pelotomaculum thermopropionicum SI]